MKINIFNYDLINFCNKLKKKKEKFFNFTNTSLSNKTNLVQ